MNKNSLDRQIIKNLNESQTYQCAPSFKDENGFYSMTNTEAYDMARDVAKYFADYATFLTNDEEGKRYLDRDLASEFANLAQNLNASLDKINSKWTEQN